MQFKFVLPLLACAVATQAMAAKPIYNDGGLGCGKIVSMRESTQMPLSSELRDGYTAPRRSGGLFLQILSSLPGVGAATAIAGEIAADVTINMASSMLQDAERLKQAESTIYKDIQAVEFQFDDGIVINVPLYVVSGMRYKVGARLNAMVSPKYGTMALGANILFASIPEVGDADYAKDCRIDNAEARMAMLEKIKATVKEDRIVNPKERRLVVISLPKTDDVEVNGAK